MKLSALPTRWVALCCLLCVPACAGRRAPDLPDWSAELSYSGPDQVQLDLLRPWPDGPRIYVQATLSDGELGLFQVDTGAAISVLSVKTARQLQLPLRSNYGAIEGLSGRANYHLGVMPRLALGEAVIEEVEFAVGVPGVGGTVGAMPLDGILGNNIWGRFLVEVDYPRDELRLHRPGTRRAPRSATPMVFNGGHVQASVKLRTDGTPPADVQLLATLDTGAGDLLLHGRSTELDKGGRTAWTVGLEPIYGLGASDIVPPSRFFTTTRRVGLQQVELGGRTVDLDLQARWVGYAQPTASILGDGWSLNGLVGHELMHEHVAVFDYQGGRFALVPSRGPGRQLDGHQVLLEQDVQRHGIDPSRGLYRARLHAMMAATSDHAEHVQAAIELLRSYLDQEEAVDSGEARVVLAELYRLNGDLEQARQVIAPLSPAELVSADAIIATVNGLLLEGRGEQALALARAAVERAERDDPALTLPQRSAAHVARADGLVGAGRPGEALEALHEAARIVQNPDAYLVRRSRIALSLGDRHGAMAHIRRMLQLYPSGGLYIWFYALLLEDEADRQTFRADVEHAMSRLHPPQRPIDFLVAAEHALGDQQAALKLMQRGMERDCQEPEMPEASRDNCIAWYQALAGVSLDEALHRVRRALEQEGPRSDYLDTRAMVHQARGELDQALASALHAARLSPDDPYMLWQVERLRGLSSGVEAPLQR